MLLMGALAVMPDLGASRTRPPAPGAPATGTLANTRGRGTSGACNRDGDAGGDFGSDIGEVEDDVDDMFAAFDAIVPGKMM